MLMDYLLFLYFTAVLFYLLTTVRIYTEVRKGAAPNTDIASVTIGTLTPWVLALILHALIVAQFNTPAGFNFALFKAFCLLTALLAGILLLSCYLQRLLSLGLFILPLAALSIIFVALDTNELFIPHSASVGTFIHILSSFVAYSMLMLAGAEALTIVAQKRLLNKHRLRWLNALPSLEAMEVFLIHLLVVGVIFLSISLASGFLIYDNLLEQHLSHKTFFSLASWIVFVIILWNYFRRHWHGGAIVKYTLWGLGLLITAYFGTKFVLEFLLNS